MKEILEAFYIALSTSSAWVHVNQYLNLFVNNNSYNCNIRYVKPAWFIKLASKTLRPKGESPLILETLSQHVEDKKLH